MAILHGRPRLEVYVECDGVRLPEFDGDEHETSSTTITKYIEARSGAEFAVELVLRRPFPRYAITIKLCIDGKPVRSRIIGDIQYRRARSSIKRTFDTMVSRIADGQCTLQRFCFSELQIEDLDDYDLGASFVESLRSMGNITLEAYYIKNLRQVPTRGGRMDKWRAGMGPIPEKALKGETLTHRMGLGTVIQVPHAASSHTVFDYVDPRRLPFATFNFKYRSRTALQSLLVIPRCPDFSPVQIKDDDVPVDDVTELKGEAMSTQVKEELGLKREHSALLVDNDSDDEVIFVSASKRQRPNITVNENGVEVIDLT